MGRLTSRHVVWALGLLLVLGTSPWWMVLAQRSYEDFQCDGVLDDHHHCLLPGAEASSQPAPLTVASVGSPPTTVGSTWTVDDSIDLVNRERRRVHEAPLSVDPTLNQAAQAHSAYLVQNQQFAHMETPDLPGFTGIAPKDRMQASGYGSGERFGSGEVVAQLSGDVPDAVNGLMSAVYHRLVMLNPLFQDVGSGLQNADQNAVLTLDFGIRSSRFQTTPAPLIVYPADHQDNVPYETVPGRETPNPMPERTYAGYPITVQTLPQHTLSITGWRLRDLSSGQDVAGKALLPGQDPEVQPYEMGFIPWDPLLPDRMYSVALSGTLDGQPLTAEWSFQTAAAMPFQAQIDTTTLQPGQTTWVRLPAVTATGWTLGLRSIGSDEVPLVVQQQTNSGILLKAQPGCNLQDGCNVTITVTDDRHRKTSATIRVMPAA